MSDRADAEARTLQDPYVRAFPEIQPFWMACAQGRLTLPRCRACGRTPWHPRAFCPFCHAADLDWIEASGTGEVYTFSLIRRGESPPTVLAYVRLDEGPILMTNIVDCDLDTVRIGQRVKAVFKKTEGGIAMPVFTPA